MTLGNVGLISCFSLCLHVSFMWLMGIWFATLFAFKLPINSPSPPYQSPYGLPPLLPRTKADCSRSFGQPRRPTAGTCRPSQTCSTPEPAREQAGSLLTLPIPATTSSRDSNLAKGSGPLKPKPRHHLNSFFPSAVGLTNKPPAPH